MNAIHRTWKHQGLHLPYGEGEPLLKTELNAPQQDHGTVDCGIFVMYIIRQYFRQQSIKNQEARKEINKSMRAEIVETLIKWGCHDKYFSKGKKKLIIKRSN